MKIGIAAGHSMNTDNPERRFEWQCCFEAELRLSRLLQAEGHEVVRPPRDLFQLENDAALLAKIDLFNTADVDVAVELHLNAGGGDYSTGTRAKRTPRRGKISRSTSAGTSKRGCPGGASAQRDRAISLARWPF